jgi:PAS domain-containing protein
MKQWELRRITVDLPGPGEARGPSNPLVTLDAVREREEPLRAVIEQLPALIWTTDRDLRFTSSLGEGFFALGLAPNQVIGLHLIELFEGAEPLEACVAAHRAALSGRTTSITLDWASRSFRANVHPLHDAKGNIIGAVGVALEVWRHRSAEAGYAISRRRP